MNKYMHHQTKTKSFIPVRILFLICCLGSLSGFPWAFLPWETVSGMTNSQGGILIDSSLPTIFLFRIQCLFFGAFSGFYLLMASQPVRYKNLIFISSVLMLLMSGAMVYVRNISGLYTPLTAYEHYLWLVIGIAMLLSWLMGLRRYNDCRPGNQQGKRIFPALLKILGIILFVNAFWVIMPQTLVEKTLKVLHLPSYFGNPYSEYAAGLIFFFWGIFGIILFICAMKPEQYQPVLKFIAGYAIFTAICLAAWMSGYNSWNLFTISVSVLSVITGVCILMATGNKSAIK